MKYQIKMSGGEVYMVSEEEAKELMLGEKKGLTGINSLRGVINMSFVLSIVPADKIDRSKMTQGVLHDGTRVIKRFGEWKDASNPDVSLDYDYYPELLLDGGVLTEEEYKELLSLEEKILLDKPPSILNCERCGGRGYFKYTLNVTEIDDRCTCLVKEIELKKQKLLI